MNTHHYTHSCRALRAFTLIELSIVLVILGLLAGGVLGGQSLIRAAQLRNVTKEYEAYHTAIRAFKDKYFMLPGDMNNATQFWGQAASCGGASALATATCDGNGDGLINAGGPSKEPGSAWKQLSNAGLVEGSFNGNYPQAMNPPGWACASTASCPASKFQQIVWNLRSAALSGNSYFTYPEGYGNALFTGQINLASANTAKVLTVREAWNIDTKIDDGKPAAGSVVIGHCGISDITYCTTAISPTDYAANYRLDSDYAGGKGTFNLSDTPGTNLYFRRQF
jgi:prepilin-type N-terminal cleavage/methylation domain-containing protein